MVETRPYSFKKPFVAEMYSSIPEMLSPDKVGTSDQYSLLLHLVRTPVRLAKDLQVEADLLESWEMQKNNTECILSFKKNQKFSNCEILNAKDFKKIIEWQIEKKSAIHFDFAKINNLILIDDYKILITFKKPARDFIRQMVHPEFGIYYELEDKVELSDFQITSGPFTIHSNTKENLLLKKNDNYFSTINYPQWVHWQSSGSKKQLEGLKTGLVDFAIPHQAFGIDEHNELKSVKSIKSFDPNMGYTFFISLNPQSPNFSSKEKRLSFVNMLSEIKINFEELHPIWENADQLYLKGGLGRPTDIEVKKTWNVIKKSNPSHIPQKIKILVSGKFNFLPQFINYFKNKKIKLDIFKYNNFDEYSEYIQKGVFDAVQVNNDFSSVELLENLLVTFRDSRPLAFMDDNKIRILLTKAENAITTEEKSEYIKKIGLKLLDDGLVFPVAHYKKLVYAKKIVSFDKWSSLYPDMRIYKIEIHDEN